MFRFSNLLIGFCSVATLFLSGCGNGASSGGGASTPTTWSLDGNISGVGSTAAFMSTPLTTKQAALYYAGEFAVQSVAPENSTLSSKSSLFKL
jgi:hypothetical protein